MNFDKLGESINDILKTPITNFSTNEIIEQQEETQVIIKQPVVNTRIVEIGGS